MQSGLLYLEVKEKLAEQIETGYYAKGAYLPSEKVLCERFGVSRITLRKAVEMLAYEGYLTIDRGKGTRVVFSKINHSISNLVSFTDLILAQGMSPKVEDVRVTRCLAPERIADFLKISESDSLFRIYRTRSADDEPISINCSYIPCRLIGFCDLTVLERKQSLYQILNDDCHINIASTRDAISARRADPEEAKILHIRAGEPVLEIERVAYDDWNNPIEYSLNVIRADRYKPIITLRKHQ